MKISPILFLGALLLVGVIGFFIGRGTSPIDHKQSVSKTVAKEETSPKSSAPKAVPTKNIKEEKKEPEPSTEASNPPKPQAKGLILERGNLGISDDKISEVLESISENMENKRLQYVSNLSQDCSGIYHQIKDSIQSRLPALNQGYKYPMYNKDRSSRQIADWYYRNGNLLLIEDPMASRNSIRPGSVLFFSKSGKIYNNITIDMLTDRNNNYTKNGAIQHIAVVTSVKTDATNNVLEYTMMHARYPNGPHASRSGSKAVQSNSAKNKAKVAPYPFGHWTQQLVAIANISTPN